MRQMSYRSLKKLLWILLKLEQCTMHRNLQWEWMFQLLICLISTCLQQGNYIIDSSSTNKNSGIEKWNNYSSDVILLIILLSEWLRLQTTVRWFQPIFKIRWHLLLPIWQHWLEKPLVLDWSLMLDPWPILPNIQRLLFKSLEQKRPFLERLKLKVISQIFS